MLWWTLGLWAHTWSWDWILPLLLLVLLYFKPPPPPVCLPNYSIPNLIPKTLTPPWSRLSLWLTTCPLNSGDSSYIIPFESYFFQKTPSSCLLINTQLKCCHPPFRITTGSPSVYALTNLPPLMSHPLWTFLFPCLSSLLNCDLWQIGIISHLYDLIQVLKTCSYMCRCG